MRDQFARAAVQNVQRAAMRLQFRLECDDAVPDEFDSPIGAIQQAIQNVGIEYKHGVNAARRFECPI